MNRIISCIFCVFILFACASRKQHFQFGETTSSNGLLLVIPNYSGLYFIECYEIKDTLNIFENIKNHNNVGAGIYLYDFYTPVNFYIYENKDMATTEMEDGGELKGKLVKFSYTKLHSSLIEPEEIEIELHLKDGEIRFSINTGLNRINYIKSLVSD